MSLLDYFLWCWYGKTEEVAETVCVRDLDDLDRQFQHYKEMKRKKADAAKRLRTYNKNLYQNL